MNKDLKQKLLIDIPNWIKNFDQNNGGINYEFSVHQEDLEETFEILNKHYSRCGNWFSCTCETCEKHHGKDFVHVSLIQDQWSEHISNASNLLLRTNYLRN
jgi:hypothetical protein